MDDRRLDLEKVHLARDEVVALYHARTARWHALQAGAVGAFGVGVVGYISGAFVGAVLLVLARFCATLLVLGAIALRAYDTRFRADMQRLRQAIETLKRQEAPR